MASFPRAATSPLTRTDASLPRQLLRTFADNPASATGDLFGQIYEYFLAEFARSEGQKGGEFFTPRSVVRLMVEIIEPHVGRLFDPACGSGGMFVQSAHQLLIPTERLITDYGNMAKPLFEQVELLMRQNTHLTRTRDLLLPRLISGKLPVESLDIASPPSMAPNPLERHLVDPAVQRRYVTYASQA